jgi:hypothetical protein
MAYVEFKPLNLLQVYAYGVLSRLFIVHIVDSMGRQVNMPILVIWYFILPEIENKRPLCERFGGAYGSSLPLIEPNTVLHK